LSVTKPDDTRGVRSKFAFGTKGPRGRGVCFFLRFDFLDETGTTPSKSHFEHEWVVSKDDIKEAESRGALDDMLLNSRGREERRFEKHIEEHVRNRSASFAVVNGALVLRPAS
jgi:hypothetical protein